MQRIIGLRLRPSDTETQSFGVYIMEKAKDFHHY
jgi:hypothetical protein